MKFATVACLLLALPVVAFADRTCDQCVDVEDTIFPTPEWQTIDGSTLGQPNGEMAYYFCAVPGETYTFSTCEDTSPGGAGYDTALSIWTVGGEACDTQMACNDDNCPTEYLHSEVAWSAGGDELYIVVVDGWSTNEGDFVLAYKGAECATATEGETWGKVKSLFR